MSHTHFSMIIGSTNLTLALLLCSCGEAQRLIREAIEMDYIMSWLSTLGGAFSSLGDQFIHCVSCF